MAVDDQNWIKVGSVSLKDPKTPTPFLPDTAADCPPQGWTEAQVQERIKTAIANIKQEYEIKEHDLNERIKAKEAELNQKDAQRTKQAQDDVKKAQDELKKIQDSTAGLRNEKTLLERKLAETEEEWQKKFNGFRNIGKALMELYKPIFDNIETILVKTDINTRFTTDHGRSNVAAFKFKGTLLEPKPERAGFVGSGKYAAYVYYAKKRGEDWSTMYLRHPFELRRQDARIEDAGYTTDIQPIFLGEAARAAKKWNVMVDPTRNLLYPKNGLLTNVPVLFRGIVEKANTRDGHVLHWDRQEGAFIWRPTIEISSRFIAIKTEEDWNKFLTGELLGIAPKN